MANGIQDQNVDQAEILANMFPKDSIEYKLLLKYAEKKKTTNSPPTQSNVPGEAKVDLPQDRRKHRKHKKSHFLKIISCIRPVKEDDGNVTEYHRKPACIDSPSPNQEDVEHIVNKLTEITDSVHFQASEIESDSDDVVERIVELLREKGDELNEEIEKNHILKKQLQDCLSYGFFKKLAKTFMQRLSTEELPNTQGLEQTEIALTCELTSRLNAMDSHPMNRVLGFGAKYLQDYFSPWVKQQGGYEKVFGTGGDSEDDVQ